MGRTKKHIRYKKRGKYWYYKIKNDNGFHTTNETSKTKAENYVNKILLNNSIRKKSNLTFRQYSEPFFIWNTCPHVKRLLAENKSIT